jgi:hypothetical protein
VAKDYCEKCGEKFIEGAVSYLITIHATADFDGKLPSTGAPEDLEAFMRTVDKSQKSAEEHSHDVYESKGFKLCAECKKKFMNNPLKPPSGPLPEGDNKEGRVH